MAPAIRMPGFGTTVEQVKLIRRLKNIDATVKRGDVLCEVETDKAVIVPSVSLSGSAQAAPNTPAPFSPPMEKFYMPSVERIAKTARAATAY